MASSTQIPSTVLFRSVSVAVLFLSTIACGLLLLGAIDHGDTATPVPALYAPAVLALIGGIALSTLLEGIARLVSLRERASTDPTPAINRLLASLNELKATLPALVAQTTAVPAAPVPPLESAADEPAAVAGSNIEQHLLHMVKLLEEMKEVSMLDENQRQTRRKQNQLRRKTARLAEVHSFIHSQQWQQADALLHLLESLHPADEDVLACRTQLDNARIASQADDWDRLNQQVNDQLALSKYTEALQSCREFLDQYPTHTDAQQLVLRIRQEQASYIESTSARLYDEIKAAVENRKWRIALDGIQSFLDRFPDHPRAAKIRQQIRVIQKNAEIEERHDQEDRIRTLINNRQFTEAADLSEALLQRFPDSPQAAYLTELLPKLRERSAVGAEDIITS